MKQILLIALLLIGMIGCQDITQENRDNYESFMKENISKKYGSDMLFDIEWSEDTMIFVSRYLDPDIANSMDDSFAKQFGSNFISSIKEANREMFKDDLDVKYLKIILKKDADGMTTGSYDTKFK